MTDSWPKPTDSDSYARLHTTPTSHVHTAQPSRQPTRRINCMKGRYILQIITFCAVTHSAVVHNHIRCPVGYSGASIPLLTMGHAVFPLTSARSHRGVVCSSIQAYVARYCCGRFRDHNHLMLLTIRHEMPTFNLRSKPHE